MSELPQDLRYTQEHEWVRREEDGLLTVGVTDHAQQALGDLVFVELPESGASYAAGDACAVVESVKAASDVYMPVAGEIAEVNPALASAPEQINADPYGEGWLFRLRPQNAQGADALLGAPEYQALLESLED